MRGLLIPKVLDTKGKRGVFEKTDLAKVVIILHVQRREAFDFIIAQVVGYGVISSKSRGARKKPRVSAGMSESTSPV